MYFSSLQIVPKKTQEMELVFYKAVWVFDAKMLDMRGFEIATFRSHFTSLPYLMPFLVNYIDA